VPEEPRPTDLRSTLATLQPVGVDLLHVDWDDTPLGPPESWPRSLQSIVTAMISSRFSMWMAWGPELTFFCNDAYRRDTLGVKYPWALGQPASKVWEEIWPDIGPRIARVIGAGEATWDEALLLFLERSGYPEETYHTFSYSPLRDDAGSIAGMLCVVTEDTERVIAQRRIALLHRLAQVATALGSEAELLAAVEARLAADQRSLPFTIGYLFDEGGTARRAWVSGIGPSHPAAPEVIPAGAERPWPAGPAAGGVRVSVELSARLGELPTGEWKEPPSTATVVPLGPPGSRRPYGFMVAALNRYRPLDEDYLAFVGLVAGQVAAGLGSARAYEAERRRAEELAALDAAKTAFFTNISHELRTPLTLILGPVGDALHDEGTPLAPVQRQRMELVARNGQRLLSLVNTLLDFSRVQSGRATGSFEPVDLARETAELAAMFEGAMADAGLSFAVDAPPLGEAVYIDRDMWAKVLFNLLSNALKFTFDGGVTVTLREVQKDGGRAFAELAVHDTGVGISRADQAHLFERFHRVSGAPSRTHEGSGIGLALVAELVAAHEGEVGVDSAPGAGSRFTVRVPFGRAHLADDQVTDGSTAAPTVARPQVHAALADVLYWRDAARPASARRQPVDDGTRPLVLVVDDNVDMRDYLAELLSSTYRVEVAVDGADALAKARAAAPDLVLTDVMMPNLDGFGLLAGLRDDTATTGVPVVFLSARAGEEGVVEGLDAGADDYVVKPFAAPELLARVRANLELDRSRRTRAALEQSRELLDEAQRLALVGSWELDLRTRRTTASPELLRQLQITAAELEAAGIEAVLARAVLPEDRHFLDAAVQAGRTTASFTYEARFRLRDGQVRRFQARGVVDVGADGQPVRVRGTNQDVTAEREAEQRLAVAASEGERAAHEQRIADELQAALLPLRDVEPDDLEVASYYRAGTEGTRVGGDWYDVIDLGGGRTALVVGDVMGRGVRAAAVMGQLRSAVRAYARLDLRPALVLESLDGVVRDLDENQIVTCIYAVYDAGERNFSWANAGHLPPVLSQPDGPTATMARAVSPPLGAGPLTVMEHRVTLPVGAVVALYTDGLVERRGLVLDAGVEMLVRQLEQASGHLPGMLHAVIDALLPVAPDDDVAVLLARVPDQRAPSRSVRFPVEPEPTAIARVRRFVGDVLNAWQLSQTLTDNVVLVVDELVTNAVLYGLPPIVVRLRLTGNELVAEVRDGDGTAPRRLRPTVEDEHGRGLQLVGALATRWGSRPTSDGKTVWCTFSIAAAAPVGSG
jgi:signal transduction histidine kinase/DNA-binding response OmpR family regulator/serine phosphatase RsbU (regulator of sigma subunit)